MMDRFTVSVVITTCNRPLEIVRQSVESVINQTYSSIQVILVNDAPFSIFRKELEDYARLLDGRIEYYVNEVQSGANYSRNYGARAATGELLAFLDDDDVWALDKIEKVVSMFKAGADFVYSDMLLFNESISRLSKRKDPGKSAEISELLKGNYIGGFSNAVFKKELYEIAGALDENMPSYQDFDLWLRLVPLCKLVHIAEPLTMYRISENSISLNQEKKMSGILQILQKHSALYSEHVREKKQFLSNELENAVANGWTDVGRQLGELLNESGGSFLVIKANCIGLLKRIIKQIVQRGKH